MADLDVEQAYRRYFPVIREKCSRMLRDPAEAQDVAQETFTRLWSERGSLRAPDGVASWIYRTSTRLAIDRYRQAARTGEGEPDDAAGPETSTDPSRQAQTRQLLARLSARVPPRELEVAVLSRLDGLNHQEIGVVLGMSDRSVRRLLRRFEEHLGRLQEEIR